jgi:glycosyltransferase involved in cell wall biosynthesis
VAQAPIISVLLPAFNSMPFLKEAVESILAQTFGDFELVIIDNGSNDGTAEYSRGLRDPRVKVLSEPKRGIGFALNKGLQNVSSGLRQAD